MSATGGSVVGRNDEQKAVLSILGSLLITIGSANDAEDHGYSADAEQMRADACQAIRDLLVDHNILADLFPELPGELESNHILGFGWANLLDRVDQQLKALPDDQIQDG